MAIPPATRAPGDPGHTTDHNDLSAWATTAAADLVSADTRLDATEATLSDLPTDIAAALGLLEERMSLAEAAILVLQREITVGTTEPATPSVNDLWVDTN